MYKIKNNDKAFSTLKNRSQLFMLLIEELHEKNNTRTVIHTDIYNSNMSTMTYIAFVFGILSFYTLR